MKVSRVALIGFKLRFHFDNLIFPRLLYSYNLKAIKL